LENPKYKVNQGGKVGTAAVPIFFRPAENQAMKTILQANIENHEASNWSSAMASFADALDAAQL